MTFIVLFVALLIERFFDWSHLRRWYWFNAYEHFVSQKMAKLPSYLVLALTILPLLIIVALIEWLLDDFLFGLIKLLFQIILLLYCLGPQNLWADIFACTNALEQGDAQNALEKLKSSFGIIVSDTQKPHQELLSRIFIESNRRVFAVIFWYAILGPVGAILYRTISLFSTEQLKQEIKLDSVQLSFSAESVLDWLPIRIFTFLFALGGHFVKVFSTWRKHVISGLSSNEVVLVDCGVAALGSDLNEEDCSAERSAVSLLDRTFVIVLVMMAVIFLLI